MSGDPDPRAIALIQELGLKASATASRDLPGWKGDVTEPEPLPADHALWGLPNVIITPHVAAQSDAQDARYWIVAQENMRRYVDGEPLLNVVDVARGY